MSSATATEKLLPLVWQQTPDFACVLLDPDGIIVGWHGAAGNIFGYGEQEVIGRSIDLIFTEEDERRGMPLLERAIATDCGRAEDDRWHVRKDGARIWISGALLALRESGKVIAFAKIMRDRTDLKTQLEAWRNRSLALEQRLEERNASLARFVHEVRNSLAPMQTAVDVLHRSTHTEQNEFPLSLIKRQIAFIDRMAGDLSDVAKGRSGKLKLHKEYFDLRAELSAATEAVNARPPEKRRQLDELLPPAPVMLWADRQRIQQVFANLLDNAAKYTPEQGRIWLKCYIESTYVIVKVQDNGVGISPDVLPRIFELFTQETQEQSHGGFGVGLALVKELVEAHGGVVEVRSQGKGRGSEFTVRLPLPGAPE